jgi:hypothetical protein
VKYPEQYVTPTNVQLKLQVWRHHRRSVAFNSPVTTGKEIEGKEN